MMPTPVMEVRGLTKHFGNIIALQDVSMTLMAGEVHCLLGDNGAGKSTLIRTLSGNFIPTAGDILFQGKPVISASRPSTRISAWCR
jgi:simple sugar transport system ATP-binding protein